jgi:hypothetical protein
VNVVGRHPLIAVVVRGGGAVMSRVRLDVLSQAQGSSVVGSPWAVDGFLGRMARWQLDRAVCMVAHFPAKA